MKITIDKLNGYRLFHPGKVEKIRDELAINDPDWSYKVVHDPKGTGNSYIEIYDEDNEFVGRY